MVESTGTVRGRIQLFRLCGRQTAATGKIKAQCTTSRAAYREAQ